MRYLAVVLVALSLGPGVFGQNSAPFVLAIDANGSSEGTLHHGWPLIIQVELMGIGETPVKMATNGSWTASVQISVESGGKNITWPLQLAGNPPTSFQLGWMEQMGAVWTLPPEFTRSLAAGNYLLKAELNTKSTAVAGGFKGVVHSRAVSLDVVDDATPLSPEDRSLKPLLESKYAELGGDSSRALSILDTVLASNARSIPALSQKADVLEGMGRFKEALAIIDLAVENVFADNLNAPEPPLDLLHQQRDLEERLWAAGGPAVAGVGPDASKPATESVNEVPSRMTNSRGTEAEPATRSVPSESQAAPAATPVPAQTAAPPNGSDNQATVLKDYQDSVSEGDSLMTSGAYYAAIQQYEHAASVADENKLNVDRAALNEKLAAARKAADAMKK